MIWRFFECETEIWNYQVTQKPNENLVVLQGTKKNFTKIPKTNLTEKLKHIGLVNRKYHQNILNEKSSNNLFESLHNTLTHAHTYFGHIKVKDNRTLYNVSAKL